MLKKAKSKTPFHCKLDREITLTLVIGQNTHFLFGRIVRRFYTSKETSGFGTNRSFNTFATQPIV